MTFSRRKFHVTDIGHLFFIFGTQAKDILITIHSTTVTSHYQLYSAHIICHFKAVYSLETYIYI